MNANSPKYLLQVVQVLVKSAQAYCGLTRCMDSSADLSALFDESRGAVPERKF